MITSLACPKVNLMLHITGVRSDGYHLLQSLVGFVSTVGDIVHVSSADALTYAIDGTTASTLCADDSNSIVAAANALIRHMGTDFPHAMGAHIRLEKHLPIASGIGGGSSDAAITLHALNQLWACGLDAHMLAKLAIGIGADVPVCLPRYNNITHRWQQSAAWMEGIGEHVTPVATAPPELWVLLVNSGHAIATADVFRACQTHGDAIAPPDTSTWQDAKTLCHWLQQQCTNHLYEAAATLCPVLPDVLAAIAQQKDCQLARMSGSGATCFGLFLQESEALAAQDYFQQHHPHYWVAVGKLR